MVAGIRSYLAADGLDVAQEVKNGSLVARLRGNVSMAFAGTS
jgi:hypothetical protein